MTMPNTPAQPELPEPDIADVAGGDLYRAETVARLLADERRKALEFAASSIDEIDDGAAPEYRACQEHIRSKIDRKEPTT